MPMKWVEPEVALEYKNIVIYHAYKSGDWNNRSEYHYSTDSWEDGDYEFDVRELPVPKGASSSDHYIILRHAIVNRLLKLPSDEGERNHQSYIEEEGSDGSYRREDSPEAR